MLVYINEKSTKDRNVHKCILGERMNRNGDLLYKIWEESQFEVLDETVAEAKVILEEIFTLWGKINCSFDTSDPRLV